VIAVEACGETGAIACFSWMAGLPLQALLQDMQQKQQQQQQQWQSASLYSAGRSTAAPAGFSGEPAAPDSAVAVAAQAGPAPGADCDMQPSHSRQGIGRRGRPPHGR